MLSPVHARCRVPDSWRQQLDSTSRLGQCCQGMGHRYVPVKGLKNATYAFRFAVIDCAGQTTPSGTYYFMVNNIDDVRQYQGRVSASTDDGMERQSNGQISLCNNLSTLTMAA